MKEGRGGEGRGGEEGEKEGEEGVKVWEEGASPSLPNTLSSSLLSSLHVSPLLPQRMNKMGEAGE